MSTRSFVLCALMMSAVISVTGAINVADVLKIPEECKDQRSCSIKPVGYDEIQAKINAALPPFLINEYKQRDNAGDSDVVLGLSDEADWDNCPYLTQRETKFLMKEGNKTSFDIIVQTDLYRQDVITVRCAREHIETSKEGVEECFAGFNLVPLRFNTICKTIYAKQSLYMYDLETSQVLRKTYELPVCCSCMLGPKF